MSSPNQNGDKGKRARKVSVREDSPTGGKKVVKETPPGSPIVISDTPAPIKLPPPIKPPPPTNNKARPRGKGTFAGPVHPSISSFTPLTFVGEPAPGERIRHIQPYQYLDRSYNEDLEDKAVVKPLTGLPKGQYVSRHRERVYPRPVKTRVKPTFNAKLDPALIDTLLQTVPRPRQHAPPTSSRGTALVTSSTRRSPTIIRESPPPRRASPISIRESPVNLNPYIAPPPSIPRPVPIPARPVTGSPVIVVRKPDVPTIRPETLIQPAELPPIAQSAQGAVDIPPKVGRNLGRRRYDSSGESSSAEPSAPRLPSRTSSPHHVEGDPFSYSTSSSTSSSSSRSSSQSPVVAIPNTARLPTPASTQRLSSAPSSRVNSAPLEASPLRRVISVPAAHPNTFIPIGRDIDSPRSYTSSEGIPAGQRTPVQPSTPATPVDDVPTYLIKGKVDQAQFDRAVLHTDAAAKKQQEDKKEELRLRDEELGKRIALRQAKAQAKKDAEDARRARRHARGEYTPSPDEPYQEREMEVHFGQAQNVLFGLSPPRGVSPK